MNATVDVSLARQVLRDASTHDDVPASVGVFINRWAPLILDSLESLLAERKRHVEALEKIKGLLPHEVSELGIDDEWSEAQCFSVAQEIASKALTAKPEASHG